jgi:hypothetical protein
MNCNRLYSSILALIFSSTAFLASGCPDTEIQSSPVRFEIPRGDARSFLDVPWPSDILLRDFDGKVGLDLRAFPNPYGSYTLEEYLGTFQYTPGYSSNAALYFNVPAGVDPLSLPQDAASSIEANASMFLVELDAPSRRIPIEWEIEEEGTSFLPAGTVTVLPLLGAIVQGSAALVVTSDATDKDGNPLGGSEDMRALVSCGSLADESLIERVPDCTPYRELREALGLTEEQVALMQIFTPYDSATELQKAQEALEAMPAPVMSNISIVEEQDYDEYTAYNGTVSLAQMMVGPAPYETFDGSNGSFVLDETGTPTVQSYEAVQFTLTVPNGTQPATGWPVVIYGHGTGGDLNSGLGNGENSEAHQLARAHSAMLAISEPLHRTRDGYRDGEEELLTFNFLNPVAGRNVWRQSALEKVQLVSAVANLQLSSEVVGAESASFDTEQISYFGHSQGGIVGALFVGVEDRITGAFLSGAGGGFAPSIIEKVEPVDMTDIVRTFLLMPGEEKLDRFHPVLALLQIWIEPAEPLNYGPLWQNRRERNTPHLAISSGLQDQYTPKRNHGALAAAFGIPLVEPVSEPVDVLDLLGYFPAGTEAVGNLEDGQGRPLTGALLQYPDDGHFAVFRNENAQEAYRLFFDTLRGGVPTARVEN